MLHVFFARSPNRVKTDVPCTSPKFMVATIARFGRKFLTSCFLHMIVYINDIFCDPYRRFWFLLCCRGVFDGFLAAHKLCAGVLPELNCRVLRYRYKMIVVMSVGTFFATRSHFVVVPRSSIEFCCCIRRVVAGVRSLRRRVA